MSGAYDYTSSGPRTALPSVMADHYSATQVDTYDLCARKWAFDKIDGIDSPPNASAALGLEIHGQLERYERDGIQLDLTTKAGEIAMTGLHFLPPPGTPGMVVEGSFMLSAWGHRYKGLKDLSLPPGVLPPPLLWVPGDPLPTYWDFDPSIPTVIDHKSTSDFKWAKTRENLPDNVQAAIYGAEAMIRYGTDRARLRWVYYRTKKPYKAKAVQIVVTRDQIEKTLIRIKTLSDEMTVIRQSGLKALDLPPNAKACSMFGGCAFQDRCNLSAQERMFSIMTQTAETDKAAFVAQIRAQMAAKGGAGVAINPPVGAMNGAGPAMQKSPDGLHYLDPATNSWLPIPPAQAAPPPPPAPPVPPPPPPGPPPAPSTNVPPGAQVTADGAYFLAPGGTAWEKVEIIAPAQVAPPPPPPPPPAPGAAPMPPMASAPAEAPKRGRGRPRKNPPAPGAAPEDQDQDAGLCEAYENLAAAYMRLADHYR